MSVVITQQADRDSVEEHEMILAKLAHLAARKRNYEAHVIADAAELAALGAKVRRWLVRRKPSLDASLPAQLVDVHYEQNTDGGASDTLRFNDEAVAHRVEQ